MSKAPNTRLDVAIACALALATVVVVGVTAQSLGFTRDEGYYFKAGEAYWGWFRELADRTAAGDPLGAFSAAVVDKHWSYNHEHPALVKTTFALSYGFSELTGVPAQKHNAFRFPAWCFAGLSVALVYALSRAMNLPRAAAVFAALLWAAMPHVFWHMHVACFDVPVCAAHTALVLCYWRFRRSLWGAVVVGVAFGLAAAVKHNALPVPALLVFHWMLFAQRSGANRGTDDPGLGLGRREMKTQGPRALAVLPQGVRLPPVPLAFFAMAVVGPVVYLLHWPWLWSDPLRRFGAYIAFHARHEHYPILYFGDLLTAPPFPVHFPFVMSAVTIPVPTLVLLIAGFVLAVVVIVAGWRRRGREREVTRVPLGDAAETGSASPAGLLALNAFYPFFLIALPSTPIFGGTKHWMNGLPFLCVLAAWASCELVARAKAAGFRAPGAAVVVVAALIVAPGVVISARVWPYGLGSYNELIGFSRGAANVGMQRTFWGYEARETLPLINERTRPNARIHFGDTNHDSWRMYKRDGLLRNDIGWSGTVRGAGVAAVEPQGEFKQQWIDVWNEWGDRSPDVVVHAEGVPLLTVTIPVAP